MIDRINRMIIDNITTKYCAKPLDIENDNKERKAYERWPTMVTSLLKSFTSLPGNSLLFQMFNFSTELFSLLFRAIFE